MDQPNALLDDFLAHGRLLGVVELFDSLVLQLRLLHELLTGRTRDLSVVLELALDAVVAAAANKSRA